MYYNLSMCYECFLQALKSLPKNPHMFVVIFSQCRVIFFLAFKVAVMCILPFFKHVYSHAQWQQGNAHTQARNLKQNWTFIPVSIARVFEELSG